MGITTIESLPEVVGDDVRALLAAADVIIGVDAHTHREFTVFGTPPLESTVSFKKPSAMNVVRVQFHGGSAGLEALGALVSSILGRHIQAPPNRPR